ncbi:MAG: SDR family NAD(P)-dependent oxidoreductase [Acidimicrobiaceae bacterium]|nr:SDR family NAD(P)-dependent oxidoreductase [Acidimicrobiaceae bacterium]
MVKVLVTGADGFIGSHLVEELVLKGMSVRAFVLYNSFGSLGWLDEINPEIRQSIEIFAGDIRDPNGVRRAMQGCETVLHLAALIAIPYSYHSPDTYIDTNIKGTLNILQAARDLEVKRIIHTSTSEVYGTAQYVPIDEKHPLNAQSPYSASKIGADQLAYSFYSSFATPVVTVRPFNTYGPRQSARAIIPTIITQVANGVTSVKVGSLTPTRDFTFIKDTVRGFALAAEVSGVEGQTINLGSNFEVSVAEIGKLIGEITGKKITLETESQRVRPINSEVDRLFADNTKARELLKWHPEFGGIDGFRLGLEQTIEWFVNPENLRRYKHELYNI